MSAGDIPTQVAPNTNYDSDDSSSSSKSLFNRPFIPMVATPQTKEQPIYTSLENILTVSKITNDEHAFKLNSPIRLLEDKINNQNATLYQQQSEIINLRKIIADLSNQFYQLKSVVNSPTHSPISHSRPNSTSHCINTGYMHEHLTANSSRSPIYVPQPNHTYISSPTQIKSFDRFDRSNGVEYFYQFQDTLNKTTAALERRDIENHLLKKQLDELRCTQQLPVKNSFNLSTPTLHITQPSSQHLHSSTFVPAVPVSQPTPITVPINKSNATSIMPFTMSLTNSLPTFGGKEGEMPTKFITEFEIRASGLFGYNDDYLIRAAQQALSDSALTWFIQAQQEQSITTWAQFKQLFLSRFRTPEKKELLRGRLRTLWQGDNESTVDYFERLKALISEIEPETSIDYIKRKFLQKLRKDIRDKITLGLTSSLSDLVQKAIEIESNIIQQKIDDKLRAAQKEENQNKHKTTIVNNLSNVPKINPSHLSSVNTQDSYDNHDHNYNYNKNRNYSENNYSRTFTNSPRSSPRTTQIQNESSVSRPIFNEHTNVKHRNNNRWCSFCSSSSHNWFHCYSNPNGPNYQPEYYRPVQQYQQQQQLDQKFTSPPDYSQQHSDRQHHYQLQNQNVLINQQQQHYEQPSSSSYLTSRRSSVSGNVQGSRY